MINLPRFSAEDADRAYDDWGANCGPGAIAAICGMSLDELRPMMGDFERKGYTNPSLMWQVLNRLGVRWTLLRGKPLDWPNYGLVRVQWEGPWTQPGVPIRARYRYTHWVGAARAPSGSVGVFDINAISNGSGWTSLSDWSTILVPWLLNECVPRASGGWHLTHVVEIQRDATKGSVART